MNEVEIKSRTRFCHFTTVDNLRKILQTSCFWCSKYDDMNDLAEANNHKTDGNRVFVLSFSHSEAFNIPVFYLYGGIDGKGCRIQFTDAKMREMLNDAVVHYVGKRKKKLKTPVPKSKYTIYCDWIHYIAQSGYHIYNNSEAKRFQSFEAGCAELEKQNKHYFIKNSIWRYENEFRIVIVFHEDIPYEKVALDFRIKNKEKGISLRFGPETTQEEWETLKRECEQYGGIRCVKNKEGVIFMDLISKNSWLYQKRKGK